ncbi:rhodanese-like domain-containing protein [Streptomyces sp. NPDC056454]|uniref:rhodanese-like domain-containing protein n=1 Tax=Streptomyces sp. NPDC056454 TaxID=3345823 RepID=UPI00369BB1CC
MVMSSLTTASAAPVTPAANSVLRVPHASPAEAVAHFGASLAFHADVSDVAAALAADGDPGFVVVDSRSTASWGPGCNGATRAALALAQLGYQVKEMLGGFEYWAREGLAFESWEGGEQRAADPLTAPVDDADCGC